MVILSRAPIASKISTEYHETYFNGSLDATSPFRHDGSLPVPEDVDEQWQYVTNPGKNVVADGGAFGGLILFQS